MWALEKCVVSKSGEILRCVCYEYTPSYIIFKRVGIRDRQTVGFIILDLESWKKTATSASGHIKLTAEIKLTHAT